MTIWRHVYVTEVFVNIAFSYNTLRCKSGSVRNFKNQLSRVVNVHQVAWFYCDWKLCMGFNSLTFWMAFWSLVSLPLYI